MELPSLCLGFEGSGTSLPSVPRRNTRCKIRGLEEEEETIEEWGMRLVKILC